MLCRDSILNAISIFQAQREIHGMTNTPSYAIHEDSVCDAMDIRGCSVTLSRRARSLSEVFERGVEWKSIVGAFV